MTSDDTVYVKTVRNSGLFMLPREARIHKIVESAQDAHNPITPKLIGYRWKGRSSDILVERIPENSLRSISGIENPGNLVANLEKITATYMNRAVIFASSHLDFYRSGGDRRLRYDISSIVRQYRRRGGACIDIAEDLLMLSVPMLCEADRHSIHAERVICHLDYYPKNFILNKGRLYIIDWGEGYIGRPGFDLGAYLMVLLRLLRPEAFLASAAIVVRCYLDETSKDETSHIYGASNRIFLPRSLTWLLKDTVEQQYDIAGKRHLWREKLSILTQFAKARSWRELGLLCLPLSFLRNIEEKLVSFAGI